MHFYAVYHDAPRKVSRSAVRLRVKEIAPAADSLSQRHARDRCVYHVEEADLLVTAYEISRYDAEYKAAVDGEPAGARIYDVKKRTTRERPLCRSVWKKAACRAGRPVLCRAAGSACMR